MPSESEWCGSRPAFPQRTSCDPITPGLQLPGIDESNRIERTDITFHFSGLTDSPQYCPEVYNFEPQGCHMVDISQVVAQPKCLRVGLNFGFFRVGISLWKTFNEEETFVGPLSDSKFDTVGHCVDEVCFHLVENEETEEGIEKEFSTAILLMREIPTSPFRLQGTIHSVGNFEGRSRKISGEFPMHDLILFDPNFPPTGLLESACTSNLGGEDLRFLASITTLPSSVESNTTTRRDEPPSYSETLTSQHEHV